MFRILKSRYCSEVLISRLCVHSRCGLLVETEFMGLICIPAVQALYSKINMSVDLNALSNVTVNVDESKITQVLRNIIRY